jgi:hypothetical protein
VANPFVTAVDRTSRRAAPFAKGNRVLWKDQYGKVQFSVIAEPGTDASWVTPDGAITSESTLVQNSALSRRRRPARA